MIATASPAGPGLKRAKARTHAPRATLEGSCMSITVVDADGHVLEDESLRNFVKQSEAGVLAGARINALWPSLDHHHNGIHVRNKEAFGGGRKIGPDEW